MGLMGLEMMKGTRVMANLRSYINILALPLIGLVILVTGCTDFSQQKENNAQINKEYAIYLLQETSISKALAAELNQLLIESTPILKQNEIARYNWKNHELELFSDVISKRLQGKFGLAGRPFVVTVGDERIYIGWFYNPLSSYLPDCPIITLIPEYESKVYKITNLGSSFEKINDKRIYETLNKAGLLNE